MRRRGLRLLAVAALLPFLLRAALAIYAASLAPQLEQLLARPAESLLLTDRHGEPLRLRLASDDSDLRWIAADEFGRWLPLAIVAAEDQRFWQHGGFDGRALARAMWQNLRHGRRISGASTISSQVIRLARPRRRSPGTKVSEFVLAHLMEQRLSKTEILEQYLNRAPFGSNLIGVEAAGQRYFGKKPADLTLAEAALLAGLPQSPSRLRPDRHPERATRRRAYVLDRMLQLGTISSHQHAVASLAPLPQYLEISPFEAPHFCDTILQLLQRQSFDRAQLAALYQRDGYILRTTLDLQIQLLAEAALQRRLDQLKSVPGGAVVVLDTATAAVRALVGSPDITDDLQAGQFNHAFAWRSPGSALKPFVYVLALDQGRILPGTALADVPRQYADYRPSNFDDEFRGTVSAREALIQSLNLPALDLAVACGPDNFHRLLQGLGIASRQPRTTEQLGIGAVLGNTEVRLLDLTAAYACLGRGGRVGEVQYLSLPDETAGTLPPSPERSVFSPEAAWLVLDMLSGEERALAETGHSAEVQRPRMAWKTGTSSGFRDAWTVAVTPAYTVGVWLGHGDGRPDAQLVGIEAAAPLVFNLVNQLATAGGETAWFARPEGLRRVEVCATSGARRGKFCPRIIESWEISGVSPTALCRIHDKADGAGDGRDGKENWPPDIASFRRTSGLSGEGGKDGPKIVSPLAGGVWHWRPDIAAAEQQLLLRAEGLAPFFWYMDGEYLGRTERGASLPWQLKPGDYRLLCSDAAGRTSMLTISVGEN